MAKDFLSDVNFQGTVTVTDTDAGSSAAPIIELYRNSSSPADSDYIGQLKFQGENDNDQKVVYAKITAKIGDATDTTEDGIIEVTHVKAGSNNISARWTSDALKLINGTGLEIADGLLTLGSTAVTATAAELNLVDGITAGTISASKAVIVDSNKDITGFRNGTLTGILDAVNFKVNGAQGSDGQVLTSTGSGVAWEDSAGGGASVTIADSAPGSPSAGNLWFESDTGKTFIYYGDGSSNQWVEVGASSAAAAGATGQIQYASSGAFASSANFTWDESADSLIIAGGDMELPVGQGLKFNRSGTASDVLFKETASSTTYATADDVVLRNPNASDIVFQTNGSNSRMAILSDGKVGINNIAPARLLQVTEGDSGVTPSASHHVVIESDDDMGLLIASGTTKNGYIRFGDSGSSSSGGFNYDHNDNSLKIRANGSDYLHLGSSGKFYINNSAAITPGAGWDGHFTIDGPSYSGGIALDDTGMWVGHNSGSRTLMFATNETERMRITSGGNVIAGLEGASYPGTDPALAGQSTSIALGGYRNSSTTTHDVFVLKSNVGSTGAVIFYVEADGDVFSKTDSYGAFPSDSRLKTTEPCRDYYEDLRKLEVINYQVTKDIKDNGDGTVTLEDLETPSKKMLGLVAQEVEKHISGLVTTNEHGYKGIRTTVLIPMLLQMCQKLADKVEALEGA
tara:strand:+ start:9975 stop:12029 length:2055 start_codon:yes stop_codon:yes gene_type:complete